MVTSASAGGNMIDASATISTLPPAVRAAVISGTGMTPFSARHTMRAPRLAK
jgi:hypothetical protein